MKILESLSIILQADGYIYSLLVLIIVNFLSAVAVAMHEWKFDWRKLADVYGRDVLPKVLGYIIIRIAVAGLTGTPLADAVQGGLEMVAFGVIASSLVARIFGHWYELGIIPEVLAQGVRTVLDRLRLRPVQGGESQKNWLPPGSEP